MTAVFVLLLASVAAAQPPVREEPTPPSQPGPPGAPPSTPPPSPTPVRPEQVPTPPPGPGGPTPPGPTAPPAAKEEEPPPPAPEPIAEPRRVPEDLLPSRAPTLVPPPTFVGPNLFNPPAPQGWLTITPSFTLGVAYDDNIFLDSRDQKSDFIVGLTPGVTATIRRPGFRLLGGYNVSGEVFLKETSLSDFGKEQNFFTDLIYQVSPTVTFTLSDQFVYDRSSNAVTGGGVSVGRRDAFRNTLIPQLRWQATQSTGVTLGGSYTLIRFSSKTEGGGTSQFDVSEEDSDTYRIGLGVDRRLTARLTGLLNFDVGYFSFQRDPSAWSYTPTIGATYEFTPTLRATVAGGATILERDGDSAVSPAIRVAATQLFKFGTLQIGYDRSIAASAVGLSDQQSIYGSLAVPTLMRGLGLEFTPRYTIVDTDVTNTRTNLSTTSNQTVKTFTMTLRGVYRIARNISVIGSYTFFQQTTNQRNVDDLDQNRVYLGVQYAFPINFY